MFAQLQSEKGEKVSELQELSLIEFFFFFGFDRAWFQFPLPLKPKEESIPITHQGIR